MRTRIVRRAAAALLSCVIVAGMFVMMPAEIALAETEPVDPGHWLQEFELGNPYGLPTGLVAGDGGTVWVSVLADRTVMNIDRTGAVVATHDVRGAPTSLATDGEGGVWTTLLASNEIVHISRTDEVRRYALPSNSLPAGVWDGGDQVYFSESGSGKLGRLTESTGVIDEWVIPGAGHLDMVTGLSNQVWVVDTAVDTAWILNRNGGLVTHWSPGAGIRRIELSRDLDFTSGWYQTTTEAGYFERGNRTDRIFAGFEPRGLARAGFDMWTSDAVNGTIRWKDGSEEGSYLLRTPDAGASATIVTEDRFVWVLEKKVGKLARLDTLSAVATSRIDGADRYEVSANISAARDPGGNSTVFIASGEKFADALSAGAVAGRLGASLLLTTQGTLPDSVRRELVRIDPERVVIVGGPASVSQSVLDTIRHELPRVRSVERVGGPDRYAVSRSLMSGADAPDATTPLYLANGGDYPDALSSTPVAILDGSGVLLIDGKSASLPPEALAIVKQHSAMSASIRIIGGPASVSPAIEAQIASIGAVKRYGGEDRYEVSVAVNAGRSFGFARLAYLASGSVFADALSGGPLAGRNLAPLYLSRRDCIPASVVEALGSYASSVTLLGGERTLSPQVLALTPCS